MIYDRFRTFAVELGDIFDGASDRHEAIEQIAGRLREEFAEIMRAAAGERMEGFD